MKRLGLASLILGVMSLAFFVLASFLNTIGAGTRASFTAGAMVLTLEIIAYASWLAGLAASNST